MKTFKSKGIQSLKLNKQAISSLNSSKIIGGVKRKHVTAGKKCKALM